MKYLVFIFVFVFSARLKAENTQPLLFKSAVSDSAITKNKPFFQYFPKRSRERTALIISALNTSIPFILASCVRLPNDKAILNLVRYSFVIGPAGGNLYALDWKRALVGSSLRYVGGKVIVQNFFACWEPGCTRAQVIQHGIKTMVGTTLYSMGITYSIITIPQSVQAYKKRRSSKANVTISPTLLENPQLINQNRDIVGGMRLELSF